jgi:hypothetical protein
MPGPVFDDSGPVNLHSPNAAIQTPVPAVLTGSRRTTSTRPPQQTCSANALIARAFFAENDDHRRNLLSAWTLPPPPGDQPESLSSTTDGASAKPREVTSPEPRILADAILVFAGFGAHRLRERRLPYRRTRQTSSFPFLWKRTRTDALLWPDIRVVDRRITLISVSAAVPDRISGSHKTER